MEHPYKDNNGRDLVVHMCSRNPSRIYVATLNQNVSKLALILVENASSTQYLLFTDLHCTNSQPSTVRRNAYMKGTFSTPSAPLDFQKPGHPYPSLHPCLHTETPRANQFYTWNKTTSCNSDTSTSSNPRHTRLKSRYCSFYTGSSIYPHPKSPLRWAHRTTARKGRGRWVRRKREGRACDRSS